MQIWVVKERARCSLFIIPYKHVSKQMKIKFLSFVVLWLNIFTAKNGVSLTLSPSETITGWRMDHKQHCRVEVGTYCKVHHEPLPSNNMVPRTYEAIALGPTLNLQRRVKFYSLRTKGVIKRRNFMP